MTIRRSRVAKCPDPRRYRVRDLAFLLLVFVAVSLLLEIDGLLGWASRMPVGTAQDRWTERLGAIRPALARAGLPAPRRLLIAASERIQAATRLSPADAMAAGTPDLDMDELAREARGDRPDAPLPSRSEQATPAGGALVTQATPAEDEARHGSSPQPGGAVRNVVLVGDSMMAVGLAPNLVRMLEKDPGLRVFRAHKSATGLSRPDVYDWTATWREVAAQSRPDLVVCAMGGNDAQNVRFEGKVLAYGTREWDDLYRRRVRAFATLLASDDAQVLWVGLPVMRSPEFAARMRHLNDLVRQEVATIPRVAFLESTPFVAGPDGNFAAFLPDARGHMVRVRTEDGVHLTDTGGRRLAERIVTWIRSPGP